MKDKVKKGFTIVEVMITAAIFIIIIAAIHQVFIVGQSAWDSDLSLLDIQQAVRRGLHLVAREARAASLVSMTMGVSCNHLTSPENCNQVTFNTPDESGIQFFHNSTDSQLIRQDSTGAQRILASNVTDVYFCCAHGDGECGCSAAYDTLDIRLIAEKTARGRVLDFTLKTKLKVRND